MTFTETSLKIFSMPTTAFSRWLNDKMQNLGLTQEALGNLVSVSHVTVSKWQRGKHLPDPPQMRRLADALEVDDIELFRLAGFLRPAGKTEPDRPTSARIEALLDKIERLSPEEQDEVDAYIDFRLRRSGKG